MISPTLKMLIALAVVASAIALMLFDQLLLGSLALLISVLIVLAPQSDRKTMIKLALRNVTRRGWNSLLLVLALSFVTASICSAAVISHSLEGSVQDQVERTLGDVDVLIGPSDNTLDRTYRTAELSGLMTELRSMDGVKGAETILVGSAPAVGGEDTGFITDAGFIGAYDEAVQGFGGFRTTDGQAISTELTGEEALVNEQFASMMSVYPGMYFFLLTKDTMIAVQVKGVVTHDGLGGFHANSPQAFISMHVASILEGDIGVVNQIIVKTEAGARHDMIGVSLASEMISGILSNEYAPLGLVVQDDIAIQASNNERTFTTPMAVVGAIGMFSVLSGVALVAGFIGIANQGRSEELSILRAIGLRSGGIMAMMYFEVLVLSALAAVLGVLIGMGLASLMLSPIWSSTGTSFLVTPLLSPLTALKSAAIVVACASAVAMISSRAFNHDLTSLREGEAPHGARGQKRDPSTSSLSIAITIICLVLGVAALIQNQLGLVIIGASIAALTLGMHPQLRYNLVYWLIMSVAMVYLWTGGFGQVETDGGIGASIGIILAGVFLLVPMAFLASALLMRYADLVIWLRRYRKTSAELLISIKRLRIEHARRTMLVLVFAALFLLVSLSTLLVGMAMQNIDLIYEESSGNFDAIAINNRLDPITVDVWNNVNVTKGVLWAGNVSLVSPIFVVNSEVTSSGGLAQNSSLGSQYIIGISPQSIAALNFHLLDFDSLFADETMAWKAVAQNESLAIIDANLAMSYVDIVGGGSERIDIGTHLMILHGGQSRQVKVIGITEQRFLGGVFVKDALVRQEFQVDAPTLLLIDFKEGLDPKQQAELLREQLFGNGLLIIDLQSGKQSLDATINEWHKVLNAFLMVFIVTLITGLVIHEVRSVRERKDEIALLKALGLGISGQAKSMLIEMSLPAVTGLLVGLSAALLLSYLVWSSLLETSGFDLLLDITSVAITNSLLISGLVVAMYFIGRQVIRRSATPAQRLDG